MTALQLTPAERKETARRSPSPDPVVLIGADGPRRPSVRKEIDAALNAHGLIKVRVFSDDRAAREAMFAELSRRARRRAGPAHRQAAGAVAPEPRRRRRPSAKTAMPGPKVVKMLKFSKSGNHRPQVKKVKVLGNMRLAAGGELKRAQQARHQRQEAAAGLSVSRRRRQAPGQRHHQQPA